MNKLLLKAHDKRKQEWLKGLVHTLAGGNNSLFARSFGENTNSVILWTGGKRVISDNTVYTIAMKTKQPPPEGMVMPAVMQPREEAAPASGDVAALAMQLLRMEGKLDQVLTELKELRSREVAHNRAS